MGLCSSARQYSTCKRLYSLCADPLSFTPCGAINRGNTRYYDVFHPALLHNPVSSLPHVPVVALRRLSSLHAVSMCSAVARRSCLPRGYVSPPRLGRSVISGACVWVNHPADDWSIARVNHPVNPFFKRFLPTARTRSTPKKLPRVIC